MTQPQDQPRENFTYTGESPADLVHELMALIIKIQAKGNNAVLVSLAEARGHFHTIHNDPAAQCVEALMRGIRPSGD